MIDYYKVIGVPRDASLDLIKKTFRALSKIYHPDVYIGDKKFAKEKIQEINEAYSVLSSAEKRKKYDADLAKGKKDKEENIFDDEFDEKAEETYSKIIESDWNFACEYYPEIEKTYNKLKILSRLLAFQFQVVLLSDKSFENYDKVAQQLETEFLSIRFGDRKDVQKIAKLAMLSGNIDFARELHKAIRILGEGAYEKVLTELAKKYKKFADKYYRHCGFMSLNDQIDWEKNIGIFIDVFLQPLFRFLFVIIPPWISIPVIFIFFVIFFLVP